MDIKDLAEIIAILKRNDVTDFELNEGGTQLKLSRAGQSYVSSAGAPIHQTVMSASPAPVGSAHVSTVAEPVVQGTKIESPIVGTFYRKPSPDAAPYAKEGDIVKKGDTLCIIEAMKLMNEIEATISGKVLKVLPNDGQVVEFGEVLFLIDPSAA